MLKGQARRIDEAQLDQLRKSLEAAGEEIMRKMKH